MSDLSDDSLHALARTHFSILALTEAQLEAVKRAVKGESVFVFTPTASGKTMCFYLVPFVLKKLKPDECFRVIIISPLIALMKDQVAFLSEKGHPAVYLCGENKASVLPSLQEKKDLFLFLTPEQAIATDVKAVLAQKKNPCCLLVVDEAHCVLEGRPEYRPEYMHLTRLLHTLNAPIMALTATPTDTVRCNLPISLGIGKYTVIEGILDRPELFLEVRTVNGLQNLDANLLKEIAQQPELTVIFCQEKNKVCDLYKQAKQVMGRRVGVYHASLSKDQKVLVIGRVMGGRTPSPVYHLRVGHGGQHTRFKVGNPLRCPNQSPRPRSNDGARMPEQAVIRKRHSDSFKPSCAQASLDPSLHTKTTCLCPLNGAHPEEVKRQVNGAHSKVTHFHFQFEFSPKQCVTAIRLALASHASHAQTVATIVFFGLVVLAVPAISDGVCPGHPTTARTRAVCHSQGNGLHIRGEDSCRRRCR